MFEIYINTLYFALRIAEFLDPENVYFKLRIFAYEDYGKDKKSLDLVIKQKASLLLLIFLIICLLFLMISRKCGKSIN